MRKPGVPLEKSIVQQLPGAFPVAPVPPFELFLVNVYVRRRPDGPPYPDPFVIGAQPPRKRQYLTREEFERSYGASAEDVGRLIAYTSRFRLMTIATSLAKRSVTIMGTAADFSMAFGIRLAYFSYFGGRYRSYFGALHVPEDLAEIIIGVVGLDERLVSGPPTAPRSTTSPYLSLEAQIARAATAQRLAAGLARDGGLWDWLVEYLELVALSEREAFLAALDALQFKTPPGVAELYNFPADADGSGQTIGIIELAGGFFPSDFETYFNALGLPVPDIRNVSVLGATNSPNVSIYYNAEVTIDVTVISGAAPGAQLAIYWAPITALGFIEAMQTAIHDRENRPSIISASWDLSEAYWLMTPMTIDVFDSVLAEAPLLGVTVCCSAGDWGALSEYRDGRAWVDYPASSPYVLSCGGTTLYSSEDTIFFESVWNTCRLSGLATGGGVSQRFPLPPWQESADVPLSANPGQGSGRGTPDVAGNANPDTGYLLVIGGQVYFDAGTSSVAPLYSALLARINESLGVNVGYINPFLYSRAQGMFRDIVVGNNIVYWPGPGYDARPGWDACTGWGSPDGTKLRDLLGMEGD